MRKIIISLLLAVIAINAMNENIAFFEKIKETEFGKTMLQTMQIQLQTSSGVDEVFKLLQTLEDGINRDAAEDKAEHTKKVNYLTKLIATLKGEIAAAKTSIAQDTKTLADKTSELKFAKGQQKKYERNVATKKALLAAAKKQREEAHAAFVVATTKLYKAIAALQEGKTMLKELVVPGKSFAEISESPVFAEVANQFKSLSNIETKYQGFFQIVVNMFNQKVGIQADQKIVARIMKIFDNLVAGLQHDIDVLVAKEKAEVAAFKSLSATLLSEINKNQALADKFADLVSDLRLAISQLNENIKNNREIVRSKSGELAGAETELKTENDEYAARSKKRTSELAVIAQVRHIFKTEFNLEAKKYVQNVKF